MQQVQSGRQYAASPSIITSTMGLYLVEFFDHSDEVGRLRRGVAPVGIEYVVRDSDSQAFEWGKRLQFLVGERGSLDDGVGVPSMEEGDVSPCSVDGSVGVELGDGSFLALAGGVARCCRQDADGVTDTGCGDVSFHWIYSFLVIFGDAVGFSEVSKLLCGLFIDLGHVEGVEDMVGDSLQRLDWGP